jgi:hypothetical protein
MDREITQNDYEASGEKARLQKLQCQDGSASRQKGVWFFDYLLSQERQVSVW